MSRHICLSVLLLSLASVTTSRPLGAQEIFRLFYEHSSQFNANESLLPSAANAILAETRARIVRAGKVPDLPANIAATPLDYQTPCSTIMRVAIVQSSPAKFLSCQAELRAQNRDTLVPIFIVKKYGNARPYYSALIVAHVRAPVAALSDDALERLQRIYLADSTSTSGHILPLHMLWTFGIIDGPTLAAAQRKFGKRVAVSTQADPFSVRQRLKTDTLAFGAIGEYDNADAEAHGLRADSLKVLLRYGLIPQGVIAITQSLLPARATIDSTLSAMFRVAGPVVPPNYGVADTNARIIAASQVGITGLVPYDGEYANAYSRLALQVRLVHGNLAVGAVEGSAKSVKLTRYALEAAGLITAFVIGLFAAGALKHRQELVVYVFFCVLGGSWFLIFFRPKILSSPALFLFVMLSAALGTTARVILRVLSAKAGSSGSDERPPVFTEAIVGLALAFGFTMVFFVTESAMHRDFHLPPAELDVQRVAIAVAVLSFGSALLIEDASTLLRKALSRRLSGGGGES